MFRHGVFADRRAVGAHCAAARSRKDERRTGPRQSALRRGGTRADTQRLSVASVARRLGQLAHYIHALPALDCLRRVLATGQQDDALYTLLVDLTTVRTHQHVSGPRKKTGRRPSAAAAAG
jgi:hypothetical protein